MDQDQIAWVESSERALAALPEVVKVLPGSPIELINLTQRVTQVLTHFVGGRTVPCTANPETGRQCHISHLLTSTRLQTWTAVSRRGRGGVAYLAITEAAVRDCPALEDRSLDLRGRLLSLVRQGKDEKGRMRVAVGEMVHAGYLERRSPNVVDFLLRLWGCFYLEQPTK